VTRRWEPAVLAIALAVAGLVALAIAFGGTATYESIMRAHAPVTFHVVAGDAVPRDLRFDLTDLVRTHDSWFAYVTGDSQARPTSFGAVLFTRDEYAHMEDVRGVFVGARLVAVIAAAAAALLVVRAWRRAPRAAVLLVRDAAIAASVGTALVAVAAAVAFDALFLLFHEVFFPQGNFLFGPDSNLIAMYPDGYWYGVTLRIGLVFVVGMAIIAIAASATLRRARR
jgi:integral membrane protein (TIGR01906 family)